MRTTWVFRPAPRGRPRRVPVGRRGAGGARGWWDKDPGSNKRVRGATWDPRGGGRRVFSIQVSRATSMQHSHARSKLLDTISGKGYFSARIQRVQVRVQLRRRQNVCAIRPATYHSSPAGQPPFYPTHPINRLILQLVVLDLYICDLSFFRARALQLPSAPP